MMLGASACKFEIPVRVHKQPLHVWSVYVHKCLCIPVVKNVWSAYAQVSFMVQYLYVYVVLVICRAGDSARFGQRTSLFGR